VARNGNRDAVRGAGPGGCPDGGWPTDGGGEFFICDSMTARDCSKLLPNFLLEGSSPNIERQIDRIAPHRSRESLYSFLHLGA
jgi:hypothetical protein